MPRIAPQPNPLGSTVIYTDLDSLMQRYTHYAFLFPRRVKQAIQQYQPNDTVSAFRIYHALCCSPWWFTSFLNLDNHLSSSPFFNLFRLLYKVGLMRDDHAPSQTLFDSLYQRNNIASRLSSLKRIEPLGLLSSRYQVFIQTLIHHTNHTALSVALVRLHASHKLTKQEILTPILSHLPLTSVLSDTTDLLQAIDLNLLTDEQIAILCLSHKPALWQHALTHAPGILRNNPLSYDMLHFLETHNVFNYGTYPALLEAIKNSPAHTFHLLPLALSTLEHLQIVSYKNTIDIVTSHKLDHLYSILSALCDIQPSPRTQELFTLLTRDLPGDRIIYFQNHVALLQQLGKIFNTDNLLVLLQPSATNAHLQRLTFGLQLIINCKLERTKTMQFYFDKCVAAAGILFSNKQLLLWKTIPMNRLEGCLKKLFDQPTLSEQTIQAILMQAAPSLPSTCETIVPPFFMSHATFCAAQKNEHARNTEYETHPMI